MTPDVTVKRRDVGRVLAGQFKDGNGAVINCTGNVNRKIFMRRAGSSTLKIDSTFSFTDETTGAWTYTLQTTDVDTVGWYNLEFQFTLPGPQTITIPTNKDKPYFTVLIQEDLG